MCLWLISCYFLCFFIFSIGFSPCVCLSNPQPFVSMTSFFPFPFNNGIHAASSNQTLAGGSLVQFSIFSPFILHYIKWSASFQHTGGSDMCQSVASRRGRWVGILVPRVLRRSSLVMSDVFCFHRLWGLVCGFFDGFRVYSLHYVCVLLFIYRTHGAPSVDVATGCFFRMSVHPSTRAQNWQCSLHLGARFSGKASVETAESQPLGCFNTCLLFFLYLCVRTRTNIMLTGQVKSCSPHTQICSLSINKQGYVSLLLGKHGTCVSWDFIV